MLQQLEVGMFEGEARLVYEKLCTTIVLVEAWIGFERFFPGSIAPGVFRRARCFGCFAL